MPAHHLTWHQYNIVFASHEGAEQVAARHLLPAFTAAQADGSLDLWWYIRKQPAWRFRYLAQPGSGLGPVLDQFIEQQNIMGWTAGIYEPETTAFGGEDAMRAAHQLFHHDSRHILARITKAAGKRLGQRETTILLCTAMLRAAGLDWYEQADVWDKVAALRAGAGTLPAGRAAQLAPAMHRLLTVGACIPGTGPGNEWVRAFDQAGQSLAAIAAAGTIRRGLRAVLAHHIIFHANRAGISVRDQAILATLAAHTMFGTCPARCHSANPAPPTAKVSTVTTLSDAPAPAADLRNRLTDQLVANGVIRSPAVEAAFRTVPRHLCLPGVPVQDAYADAPVYVKQQGPVAVSAASQPTIVAMMLEQLRVQPGDNILEIGAGTGYNAALLATLTGPGGHVTTIDVDDDLVSGARQHLAAAGITNADVVLGDGALGYPPAAPFDKVIATVGAAEVPAAWLDQTAPGARLIIPLRLRGAASRSIEFERGPAGWVSTGSRLAVFMPLRGGIRDDPRRIVPLTTRQDITLQVHQDQHADPALLTGVLDSPRHEEWTSVLFPPDVPYEWMDLWLCLTLPNALMRMNVQPDAVARGQVSPMFGWGSMVTTDGASLAYLTTRPAPPAADGGKRYEVGVIAHGPGGPLLAGQVAAQIQGWDSGFRDRRVQFSLPARPCVSDPADGRFVLDRPGQPITVIWQ